MGNIFSSLKSEVLNLLWIKKTRSDGAFDEARRLSQIILALHSIEKGLSINKIRLGFGYNKIMGLFAMIEEHHARGYDMNATEIVMSYDAVSGYLRYHDDLGFTNANIEQIREAHERLGQFIEPHEHEQGGTLILRKTDMDFDLVEVTKFFKTRHSVRDFAEGEIEQERLKKAIELAQLAPSACNRQAYRIYAVGKPRFDVLKDYLEGVGGFEGDVSKMLIITGKASGYGEGEGYQYIVSASIFAAYLSLSLHAHGLGACMIQRPVRRHEKWAAVSDQLGIPEDEQVVCMIGVGGLKDEFKVPVSHRLEFSDIATFID